MRFGGALLDSRAILSQVPVVPGMHVADFASGRTGQFCFPASSIVGEAGCAYAVDINKQHIAYLQDLSRMCVRPVETIWGDIECLGGVAIAEAALDVIFLVHSLSSISRPDVFLSEVGRLLKPSGVLVVIDWKVDYLHPVSFMQMDRFSKEDVEYEFLQHGWVKKDDLVLPASHWGLIFERLT